MARSLLLSLLVRQHLALKEKFRARYPHSWLVWESGAWNVSEGREQNHGATRVPNDDLSDCLPTGDAMCFELSPGREVLSIGRASHNHFVINDATVSREHLVLRARSDDSWTVEAHEHSGQTLLEGQRLPPGQPAPLGPGMHLMLGDVRLTFHDSDSFHQRMADTAQLLMASARGGPGRPL